MKVTYDEYIALLKSPESKEFLDSRISDDANQRYMQRMNGAGSEPESISQLDEMSPKHFKSLRAYQISQLYEAYLDAYNGKTSKQLWIQTGTTDSDKIRRVVGDKPGQIYNNGVLALDHETILAVNYLAQLRNSDDYSSQYNNWAQKISFNGLETIVNEMIAIKNILSENMKLDYADLVGTKIYRETDIAKRAIGKNQHNANCFEINDFELTWQQLAKRKSSSWVTVRKSLFDFLDKKLHPNADRHDPNRIGNRTTEVEYTGGER